MSNKIYKPARGFMFKRPEGKKDSAEFFGLLINKGHMGLHEGEIFNYSKRKSNNIGLTKDWKIAAPMEFFNYD